MRSIRSLSLGRLKSTRLNAEDFVEFGVELEDLKLTRSSIQAISPHAFKNVRGLRRLDLSENRIERVDNDAFNEVKSFLFFLDFICSKSIQNRLDRTFVNIPENITWICGNVHLISHASVASADVIART